MEEILNYYSEKKLPLNSLKYIIGTLVFLFFYIFIFVLPAAATNPPNVTLVSPNNSQVFNTTNNITFVCNATDDYALNNLTLYHNISGSFNLNKTKTWGGELQSENGNVLLMHFNNDSSVGENSTYVYDWSGNGNNGTVINVDYNTTGGKFGGAFNFSRGFDLSYSKNESIEVADSNRLDLTTNGTIEAWINVSTTSDGYYSVFTKGDQYGDFSPYALWLSVSSGKFLVILYLSNTTDTQIANSLTTLNFNKWYHIAVTWNGTTIRFYINGRLDSTSTQAAIPSNSERPLTIGKDTIQQYTFKGLIDELAIYSRTLSADEIDLHANKPNNATQNWTINNIPDGRYTWNCLAYDNETQSDWGDANWTFTVDINPPTFNSIVISPNSTDDIDPSVRINVTANVTDVSNVSIVVLQWKEVGDWNNVTMTYNATTGLYNASFNIDSTGGIYYYRIWSNDTNGHGNTSDTRNITAAWDYSWARSPANLGTTSGYLNSIDEIGILTINNTGDDTLTFSLSDNWPLAVYYNGSETASYNLNAKNITTINITAKFAGSDSESTMTITTTASHPTETPSPTSSTTNATLSSYSGGPYFIVTIASYSSNATQSGAVKLNASVKNIGNETATATWLNWTLPSGWSNTSGNLTQNVSNLTSGSTAWNNLTATLNATSSTAGIATIYVNASSGENINGSDSKLVTVNCNSTDSMCGAGCTYITDTDCPSTTVTYSISGGGGAAVVTAAAPEKRKGEIWILESSEIFEVVRNKTGSFSIKVKNIYTNAVMNNITLNATGFPSQYITIQPSLISKIGSNQSDYFNVIIRAPTYVSEDKYSLKFTVQGRLTAAGSATAFAETRYVTLISHEISKEEANETLVQAEDILNFLLSKNLPTGRATLILNEIRDAVKNKNYGKVNSLYENIRELKAKGSGVADLFEDVENKLEESKRLGLDAPQTRKMYYMARFAFLRSDFSGAEEVLNNAQFVHAVETKGKVNVLNYIKRNWISIFSSVAILSVAGFIAYGRISLMLIRKKLIALDREELSIIKLIRDTQRAFLEEKRIDAPEYHKLMYSYESNLEKIKQGTIELASKRVGWIRTDVMKNLKGEDAHIDELTKKTQSDYFEKGVIEKPEYDRRIKSFIERKVEIEKKLMIEEAKKVKEGGWRKYLIEKLKIQIEGLKGVSGKLKNIFEKLKIWIGRLKSISEKLKNSLSNFGERFKKQKIKPRKNADKKRDENKTEFAAAVFLLTSIALLSSFGIAQAQAAAVDLPIALNATATAEKDIKEMEDAGFGTTIVNDTLFEARKALNEGDYQLALEKTKAIADTKKKAYYLNDSMGVLEIMMADAESRGLNVTSVKEILDSARVAFGNERYEETDELIDRGYQKLQGIEIEATRIQALLKSASGSLLNAIKRNWVPITISSFIILIASSLFHIKISEKIHIRRIKEAKLEIDILKKKMGELQKEFFEQGAINEDEYNTKIEKYEEMLNSANKSLFMLRSKPERLEIIRKLKALKIKKPLRIKLPRIRIKIPELRIPKLRIPKVKIKLPAIRFWQRKEKVRRKGSKRQ